MVDKNVLAIRAAQKAKTLRIVKPLHCSLFHNFGYILGVKSNAEWKSGYSQVVQQQGAERAVEPESVFDVP
jgi:hypothetical protein